MTMGRPELLIAMDRDNRQRANTHLQRVILESQSGIEDERKNLLDAIDTIGQVTALGKMGGHADTLAEACAGLANLLAEP